jgi:hypothetical protein
MTRLAVLAAVLSVGWPGCSSQETISRLSPDEAKNIAQQMENRIPALVPKEYVESHEQRRNGVVMPCGKGAYAWHGHTYLTLKPNVDFERTMRELVTEIRRDPQYQVRMTKLESIPIADIRGPFGAQYMAGESLEATKYSISSSSPCFELPDGIPSGGSF